MRREEAVWGVVTALSGPVSRHQRRSGHRRAGRGLLLSAALVAVAFTVATVSAGCGGEPAPQRSAGTLLGSPATDAESGASDNGNDNGDVPAGTGPDLASLDVKAWTAVLGAREEIALDQTKVAVADLGPWIAMRQGGAAGYADLSRLVLADLSGDGRTEAVIPLVAGADRLGTAAVLFTSGEDGPAVVGDQKFYSSFGFNTRATLESGELVVRHSVGAGWEPLCCYSGEVSRRFRTNGIRVVETSPALEVGNVAAKGFTVDRFYSLLNAKNVDAAMAMLTDGERARTRDSLWPVIWSQAAQINVNILSTPRADGLFAFRLLVADGLGGVQSWQGGAELIYMHASHTWQIDLLSLQPE